MAYSKPVRDCLAFSELVVTFSLHFAAGYICRFLMGIVSSISVSDSLVRSGVIDLYFQNEIVNGKY